MIWAARLRAQGKLDEATRHFARALALKPEYPQACSRLGVALQTLGNLAQAEVLYRRALALKPEFPEAWSKWERVAEELVREWGDCCRAAAVPPAM
jgi:tetratricopeptide (TPR) repeat protein